MSDIENKRITVKPTTLNLSDMAAEITKILQPVADKKEITLESSVSPDAVEAVLDSKLTEKILSELLHNGINYSTVGSPVRLNITKEASAILFEVQNHGEPISQEESRLMFTKYFRGSNRSSDVSGAGLGLYITREYVKLLGGKIWFTSEKDKTTFMVELPLS